MGEGDTLMPVMIVDDNEHVCEFISFLLEDEGYRPVAFSSPTEALSHIRKTGFRPRYLITDFNLPEMSGHELYRAIRRLTDDIKTIIISGRQVADQIGDLPFLHKPFTPDELLDTLKSLSSSPPSRA